MTRSESEARDYQRAVVLIHEAVAGTATRRDVRDRWPDRTDPTLAIAREDLNIWFLPEVQQDPAARAELQAELERVVVALRSGESLVPENVQRTWWRMIWLRDNIVGLVFIVGVVLLLVTMLSALSRLR